MIERMKKTIVLTTADRKAELISSLRDLGVMHITDMVTKSGALDEMEKKRAEYASVLQTLKDRCGKPQSSSDIPLSKFLDIHQSLSALLEEEQEKKERLFELNAERERILPFGDFDPEDVKKLASDGIKISIYTGMKKDIEKLSLSDTPYIPLAFAGKSKAVAVLGESLPDGVSLSPFTLPEMALSQIESELIVVRERLDEIDRKIKDASIYIPLYKKALESENEKIIYQEVTETVSGEDIVYLTGYIPALEQDRFITFAKENSLAYQIEDPGPDDNPPTKVRYKGFTKIVKPVFDILGTVPGYNEYDTSPYFLVFFSLFFAMIIGDAGYGLIFILIGFVLRKMLGKGSDIPTLVFVLGGSTVVWGALTGTWFGSLAILERLPFLQKLIIPSIANYPELFDLDSTYTQNMLMKFCFMIGTFQLSFARVLNIIRKAGDRDLSLVADIGWLLDSIVLYFLALNLVIGGTYPLAAVGVSIGVGFLLVCLFSSQGPGVPFCTGVKRSLAGFFTTFLDTISCFSNLMSYIRLFAVGMASLAIAQSFNGMGDGMMGGATFIFGIIIIIVGHALNLVMGILSVVVHGVRLNLLEFSGALGMEWAGYNYDPFRKMVEETNTKER